MTSPDGKKGKAVSLGVRAQVITLTQMGSVRFLRRVKLVPVFGARGPAGHRYPRRPSTGAIMTTPMARYSLRRHTLSVDVRSYII